MFGAAQQEGETGSNDEDDDPLGQHETFDPLTNKLKSKSSKWGDYESGVNNGGVNGHLGHKRNGSDGVIIELGAGALTKTKVLLRALHGLLASPTAIDDLTYWAVDLEHGQLVSTLSTLAENERDLVDTRAAHGKIHIRGVRASYEEVFPHLGNGGLASDRTTTKQQRQSIL
jgi:hypothetical protein